MSGLSLEGVQATTPVRTAELSPKMRHAMMDFRIDVTRAF